MQAVAKAKSGQKRNTCTKKYKWFCQFAILSAEILETADDGFAADMYTRREDEKFFIKTI